MSELSASPGFDTEYELTELLPPALSERVLQTLSALTGVSFTLLAPDAAEGADLCVEFEALARLQAALPAERLRAAAELVNLLIRCNARYRLAADMHAEVVTRDFEALQAEHAALQTSEARYRQLAAELEQRVADQVKAIENTQQRLYESEKLYSLGQLAAGVAHEINNPIGFAGSNLRTARGYLTELRAFRNHIAQLPDAFQAWNTKDLDTLLEDFDSLLDETVHGVMRVANIVRDLQGLTQAEREQMVSFDINEQIDAMLNVAGTMLSEHASLETHLRPVAKVWGHPGRMGQALLKLALNGVQAMPRGGRLVIETDSAGEYVQVLIRDSGEGIPPERLGRIFEPFYTTRPVGEGTGLGLTVARETVLACGGRIDVDSVFGEGTTVRLLLPAAVGRDSS